MNFYPEHIYRCYDHGELVQERRFQFPMRCWYPSQFEELVEKHGFEIVNRWGGYAGAEWGYGPEGVKQFRPRDCSINSTAEPENPLRVSRRPLAQSHRPLIGSATRSIPS